MGRLLLGITLMTVLLSAHAHAELKELGEIPGADGWKLAANPDTEVCMMTAHYTLRNGSTMTLMLMNGNEGWAIRIANNKWELPTGAKYRLNFEMSTGKKYYASF
jgi:hypothetical protein